MRKSGWFSVLQGVSYLAQVGLSVATPLVLMLLLASWLVRVLGLGAWLYLPALVLGLGAGVCSLIGFARYVTRKNAGKSDASTGADAPVYVPRVPDLSKAPSAQPKRGERTK